MSFCWCPHFSFGWLCLHVNSVIASAACTLKQEQRDPASSSIPLRDCGVGFGEGDSVNEAPNVLRNNAPRAHLDPYCEDANAGLLLKRQLKKALRIRKKGQSK